MEAVLCQCTTKFERASVSSFERLFSKVRYCAYHVLEELLPPKSDSQHNLRNGAIT